MKYIVILIAILLSQPLLAYSSTDQSLLGRWTVLGFHSELKNQNSLKIQPSTLFHFVNDHTLTIDGGDKRTYQYKWDYRLSIFDKNIEVDSFILERFQKTIVLSKDQYGTVIALTQDKDLLNQVGQDPNYTITDLVSYLRGKWTVYDFDPDHNEMKLSPSTPITFSLDGKMRIGADNLDQYDFTVEYKLFLFKKVDHIQLEVANFKLIPFQDVLLLQSKTIKVLLIRDKTVNEEWLGVDIAVHQNGKALPAQNNRVQLQSKPFTLFFATTKSVFFKVHASFKPDVFNQFQSGVDSNTIDAFGGGIAMAEYGFNVTN